MEINEHIIKISGKATSETPLTLGEDYEVTIEGEIRGIYDSVNDNGSIDRVYALKTRIVKSLLSKGKKLSLKDKSSISKRIRGRLYVWCQDNDVTDFEGAYQDFGSQIINHFDEIMNLILELKQ